MRTEAATSVAMTPQPDVLASAKGQRHAQFRINRWTVLALLGIVSLGAALRLYHIQHQSMFWDEAGSLAVARAPLVELPRHFKLSAETAVASFGWKAEFEPYGELNPPLYFIALHAWFELFGVGPLQARLMSTVAGVLALIMIFKIGVSLYDIPTALIATLLLAVSQLGIMFSQEARDYAPLLLLFLTTVHLFIVARSTQSVLLWCCFTVSAVLMVGTHYYGALALLALGIHTVLYWRRAPVPLTWLAGSALAGIATLGPWMAFTLLDHAGQAPPDGYRWNVVRWTTALSTLNRFNNGAVDGMVNTMPRWTFVAGALLFTVPVVAMVLRWLKGTRSDANPAEGFATSLCLLTGLVPVVLVLGLGLAYVKYDVRYVAFCIAPYYLLVAAGIWRLRPAILKVGVIVGILCHSSYALRANYWIPYKENFRDAAGYVSRRAMENDCYAFVPFRAPPLGWMIYMPGPSKAIVRAPDYDSPSPNTCQRTWVVTYQRGYDEIGIPEPWREWLRSLASTNQKIEDEQFFWIRVELYTLVDVQAAHRSSNGG